MAVDRQTVDLSAYPDLVVFYLGIRVRRPRGMLRLLGLGWLPSGRKAPRQPPAPHSAGLSHRSVTISSSLVCCSRKV